jgi:hypothetical protein
MNTVRQDAESQPCVAPIERPKFHRVFGALSFPGGAVELDGMVLAHPGGVTPSTMMVDYWVNQAKATLELVERSTGEERARHVEALCVCAENVRHFLP